MMLLPSEDFFAVDIALINLIISAHKFWKCNIESYGVLKMKTQGRIISVANQIKVILKTYFVLLMPPKHIGLNSAYAAPVSFDWRFFSSLLVRTQSNGDAVFTPGSSAEV